jgi:hypothetical protein
MNSARRFSRPDGSTLTAGILSAILAITVAGSAVAAPDRSVLAYWAFNCFTTCGDANFIPETVSQSAASMSSSFPPDDGANESGTPLNAIPPYEARADLTLRTGTDGANNGRALAWRVNTTGFSGIRVSFAVRRSPAGFSSNQFQYTLDGTNFVNVGPPFDPGATYTLLSHDLRHVRGLNDNANAGFRIVFDGGSITSPGEFAAIDNIQVVGK